MLSPLPKNCAICCFELLVDVLRAADEADAGEAVAPGFQPFEGRGDDVRVVGEAEVVVRAEVDDLAAVDADAGPLRRSRCAARPCRGPSP